MSQQEEIKKGRPAVEEPRDVKLETYVRRSDADRFNATVKKLGLPSQSWALQQALLDWLEKKANQ